MLRGISPLITPELLMVLADMGHGEEILLADANFPSSQYCRHVLRAPGVDIPALLSAIMPLWTLDYKTPPLHMPESANGVDNTPLARRYLTIVRQSIPTAPEMTFLPGPAFYQRTREARICVVTGDRQRFANLLVRKGIFLEGEA